MESLGFIIIERSALTPSKKCKFLGFLLNSESFCIKLPTEKKEVIRKLSEKFLKVKVCKIRELARFIGTLVAACPANCYGWVHIKQLEREKFLALRKHENNFNKYLILSDKVNDDLQWWIKMSTLSANPIKDSKYKQTIFTDASLSGWGGYCEGKKANGWWSAQEREFHINQCFASDLQN